MFHESDVSCVSVLEDKICALGLFPHTDSKLAEYPETLHKYCGAGLGIWQYPSQFARYLMHIKDEFEKLPILRYLEVGVAAGGTFTATREFLLLLCRMHGIPEDALFCAGIDPAGPGGTFRGGRTPFADAFCKYLEDNAASVKFYSERSDAVLEDVAKDGFDLVLVDGDHSYEGVDRDFRAVKETSRMIVLHDIVSDACPGVVRKWNEVKGEGAETVEFVDQYLYDKQYLGIGLVRPSEAYVTMANKPEYLVQCLVLAASIREHDLKRDIIVMVFDYKDNLSLQSCLKSNEDVVRKLRVEIRLVENPIRTEFLNKDYGRLAQKYFFDYVKLVPFSFTKYACVLFMDGDMVVTAPVETLFALSPPPGVGKAESWIAASDGPASPLNSGLVRIVPRMGDYRGLLKMVKAGDYHPSKGWRGKGGVFKGSSHTQGLFSSYFEGHVHRLDRKVYNNQVEEDLPESGVSGVKIFHMTGHGKPVMVRKTVGAKKGSPVSEHVHAIWNDLFRTYKIHDN